MKPCACGCGRLASATFVKGHNRRGMPWPASRRRPLAERFAEKVDTGPGLLGCWPWTGNKTAAGYGVIKRDDGSREYAHRVALEFKLGRPIADGMHTCHTCDNPPCVNPAHLYEGTPSDNVRDTWARIRGPKLARASA